MNQLLTSVVREIRTLRSVGAGERATAPGHPVAISNGRHYLDHQIDEVALPNWRLHHSREKQFGWSLLAIETITA